MNDIDRLIRQLWNTHSTEKIAREVSLKARTVRWRAGRLGLSAHPRGRKKSARQSIATIKERASAKLPISSPLLPVPRATLPKDFEAYRPGQAPQPVVRKDP